MNKLLTIFFLLFSITILDAKDKSNKKEVIAIYKDATFYTGYTSYLFTDSKTGKEIEIQAVSGEKKVKAPKDLLEDTSKIEGIPGANPEKIGKKYSIQYLKNDKIIIKETK